jgi:hypothetical protein
MKRLEFLLLLLLVSVAGAIDTISIRGNRFINDRTGATVLLKGLAYQPTVDGQFRDVIADDQEYRWAKDLPKFQDLQINVLRIYEVRNLLYVYIYS